MKKLIEKIKNFFNAKDLDKYDDLPLQEQYYRLRIHTIKEAEKTSRLFVVCIIVLLIILVVGIAVAVAMPNDELGSEVTASAAEENVYAQVDSVTEWYNYTVYFNVNSLPYLDLGGDTTNYPLDFYGGYTEYGSFIPYSIRIQDVNGNVVYTGSLIAYDHGADYTFNLPYLYNGAITEVDIDFSTTLTSNQQFTDAFGYTYQWRLFNLQEIANGITVAFSSDYYIDVNALQLSITPTILDHQHADDEAQRPFPRPWFNLTLGGILDDVNTENWFIGENWYTTSSTPYYSTVSNTGTAYNNGYSTGFNTGFDSGFNTGFNGGYNEGSSAGFDSGFNSGFERGKIVGAENANDYSFLSLVSSVFDAPIALIVGSMEDTNNDGVADTRVGGLLNFDLLGVNIASFLLAIFTVCVIIALVKLFLSR